MTKIEQLQTAAATLNDDQVDTLIAFARTMKAEPVVYSAGPELLASMERGLAQAARGEVVPIQELRLRLEGAAKSYER